MNLAISAWALLGGTVILYLLGAINGYTSKALLIIFGVLLLAQIVIAAFKRAWSTILLALGGVLILGLWKLAGNFHQGVLQMEHSNPVLKTMNDPVAPIVAGLIPLALVVALVVLLKTKGGMSKMNTGTFSLAGLSQKKQKGNPLYPNLRICKSVKTGKDVYINGEDRFLHTMIVGPTGGGKTALMLEPMVNQDIEYIAKGGQARVIVVEPDGEFTNKLANYCEELNVPYFRIDATNPGIFHWNPLEGDPVMVAETLTTVLKDGSSKNEFFSDVNSTVARNTTLLLKLLHGDDMTIMDLNETLLDVELLLQKIKQVKEKRDARKLNEEEEFIADNLIKTFESELSDDFKKGKYQSVSMGLRQKVGRLIGNPNIRKIMMGKSNFRFEDYLETPGVLLLNTGNNEAGDTFGMFFLLSKNDATLRRPGNADSRTAVFTYVDEYKRYATSKYVSSLTQGRKYRDAQHLAFQNFSQLDLVNDPSFKKEVKGNCRHKIVLSGLEYDDAKEASMMTGEQEVKDESVSYQKGFLSRDGERTSERMVDKPRFSANDLMFMPWNQIVYKIVQNKQTLPPALGTVEYAKRKILADVKGSRRTAAKKPNEVEKKNAALKPAKKQEATTNQGGYSLYDLERELSLDEVATTSEE